ncbi:MAG: nodulation S family protein [Bacteroidota bacterium]|nr:nodulation S family protein [Bacteroidota bacterium]
MKKTLPASYFSHVYNNSSDPWNFETSPYEKAKYEATVAALPEQHYNKALELGCSIGVLTAMLAKRCSHLLSTDISDTPLQKARERLKNQSHVSFLQAAIPAEYPEDKFDLIVMSEVGYYLSKEDLEKAKEKIIHSLEKNGDLILVHWLPVVPDYPLTGDEVHDLFLQPDARLQHLSGMREEKYRMDVVRKIGGQE